MILMIHLNKTNICFEWTTLEMTRSWYFCLNGQRILKISATLLSISRYQKLNNRLLFIYRYSIIVSFLLVSFILHWHSNGGKVKWRVYMNNSLQKLTTTQPIVANFFGIDSFSKLPTLNRFYIEYNVFIGRVSSFFYDIQPT